MLARKLRNRAVSQAVTANFALKAESFGNSSLCLSLLVEKLAAALHIRQFQDESRSPCCGSSHLASASREASLPSELTSSHSLVIAVASSPSFAVLPTILPPSSLTSYPAWISQSGHLPAFQSSSLSPTTSTPPHTAQHQAASRSFHTDNTRCHSIEALDTTTLTSIGPTKGRRRPSVLVQLDGQGQKRDQVLPVTNLKGEDCGQATLRGDVFDVPIRKDIVHRVVVWQLAKRRQGTHSTKRVGEVTGSHRKPWNQKGTGRARHGSRYGPQFRGGAVVHGPKPRSHATGLQKKVRRLGLRVALSARLAEGKLKLVTDLTPESHKTKLMQSTLQELLPASKKVLLVDGDRRADQTLLRATSNLYRANVLPVLGLNVYSILQHDSLVLTVGAARGIEERLRADRFQPRWRLRREVQQQQLLLPSEAEGDEGHELKAAAA